MADIDIDPFGDHESRPEEPTGENIPLTPGEGSTWEPEREQETSFGGESQRTKVKEDYVRDFYHVISKEYERTSEAFYFEDFKLEDRKLHYIGKSKPLTKGKWKIRAVGAIMDILGKERLLNLGFDIPVGKVTAQ